MILRREHIGHDLDAVAATLRHREILLNKPFLKKLYTEWYQGFIRSLKAVPEGQAVELGAGGGFLKDLLPDVITSDIQEIPHCDQTFSAEEMPFEAGSLRAIFMLNVLHHIPDIEKFLGKAEKTLAEGGIIYMVEPANTLFSRWVYTRLHHEPFDPQTREWSFPSTGPMSGANGALPWIVFKRDRQQFEEAYPLLKVEKFSYTTPLRYLLSGGFSYKSFVPAWSFGFWTALELLLKPLWPACALFQIIVVRKTGGKK